MLGVAAAKRPHIETYEDVIASREKRKLQLEKVVQNAKKELEKDHTGKKKLSDQARAQFQTKIRAYEEQIKELGRELDQDELDQILLKNRRTGRTRTAGDEL